VAKPKILLFPYSFRFYRRLLWGSSPWQFERRIFGGRGIRLSPTLPFLAIRLRSRRRLSRTCRREEGSNPLPQAWVKYGFAQNSDHIFYTGWHGDHLLN